MVPHSQVLLFADQTVELGSLTKALCHQASSSPTLQVFLRRTHDALRQEIATHDHTSRSILPSFESILDLAEAHAQYGERDTVVSTVLLCITQLGLLLMYDPFGNLSCRLIKC